MDYKFCQLRLRSFVLLIALLMSGLLFPSTSHAHGGDMAETQLDLGLNVSGTHKTEIPKHCGFGSMCIVVADIGKRESIKITVTNCLRQIPDQSEHSHINHLGVDIPPPRQTS